MKQLDSLPASNDKFWEGADIHPNIEPKRCFIDNPHFFVRVQGHQAQCKDCWWGFQLDPGDKIIEGHLFDRTGKKVL